MNLRTLLIVFSVMALLLFAAQPLLAHCGSCGMGDKRPHHEMKKMHEGMEHPCSECPHYKDGKHACENCPHRGGHHDHDDGHGKHHGKLKCAECEKAGHHGKHHDEHHGKHHDGHHGMHHGDGHDDAEENLEDLFDDRS